MYKELYTQEDLINRGWNDALINKLSNFSHEFKNNQTCWSATTVFNIELYPEAKKLNLPTYNLLIQIQKHQHLSIEKILSNDHHKNRKNEIFLNICEMKSKDIHDIDKTQYFTLYTDGCYMEELFFLGYGGYIENKDNQILVEYTEKIDSKEFKHYHELLGFIHGLKLAHDMNIDKLLVLTDSLNNVLMIKNLHHLIHNKIKCNPKIVSQYITNPKQVNLICEALELIRSFDDFQMFFIPRDENKHADELSRQSLQKNKDLYYKGLEKSFKITQRSLGQRKKEDKSIFFSHPQVIHMQAMLNPFIDAKEKSNMITEQQKNELAIISQSDKLYILEDKTGKNVFCVYHDKHDYEYFLNTIEMPIRKSNETINHYEKEVEKVHYYALNDALEKIIEIRINNDESKDSLGLFFKNKHVMKLFQCSAKMDLDEQRFPLLCDIYEKMNDFKELRIRHSLDKHHIHADDVLELTNLYEKIQYDENEFYQLKNNTYYEQDSDIEEDNIGIIMPHLNEPMLTSNMNNIESKKDNDDCAQDFLNNIKNAAQNLWQQIVGLTNINSNINTPSISNISTPSSISTENINDIQSQEQKEKKVPLIKAKIK